MCKSYRRESGVCGMTTVLLLLLLLLSTATAKSCHELQCLNNNPCQSLITRDSMTHARCLCGGKWAGPRCQYQLHLKMEAVTSSTVRLRVDLTASQNHDVEASMTSEETVTSLSPDELRLNYTLAYWRNEESEASSPAPSHGSVPDSAAVSCVLLHKRTPQQPTVRGLLPSARYTICIESGSMDSCLLSSFIDPFSSSAQSPASSDSASSSESTSSWPSNCVTFMTRDQPGGETTTEFPSSVIVVAVSVAVLALVLSIVVILVRRHVVSGTLPMVASCWGPERCRYRNPVDWAYLPYSKADRSELVDDTVARGDKTERRSTLCQQKRKVSTHPDLVSSSPPDSSNLSETTPLGVGICQEHDSPTPESGEQMTSVTVNLLTSQEDHTRPRSDC